MERMKKCGEKENDKNLEKWYSSKNEESPEKWWKKEEGVLKWSFG